MPLVDVRNLQNEVVGQIELSDAVFNVPLNRALIYDAVRCLQAGQRSGTASTKTRGEVAGAGRKLWRQKGTGRARIGSLRSPVWRHGGTVHGPRPRDYSYTLPKRMRQGAVRVVLSERLREGNILVIEALELSDHRTKGLAGVLGMLGITGDRRALIIDQPGNQNLRLSSRNLPRITQIESGRVNIVDLLGHERLLFSRAAIVELDKMLGRGD